MPDPFRRFNPGDQLEGLPASFYNTAIDAALQYIREHSGTTQEELEYPDNLDLIVSNRSGLDLNQYGIVGLGDPEIDPGTTTEDEDHWRAITVLKSAAPVQGRPFAITQDPMAASDTGSTLRSCKACASGISKVKINVTDSSHIYAGAANGDYDKLASAVAGPAKILWKESGTGVKWSLVRLNFCVNPLVVVDTPDIWTVTVPCEQVIVFNKYDNDFYFKRCDGKWVKFCNCAVIGFTPGGCLPGGEVPDIVHVWASGIPLFGTPPHVDPNGEWELIQPFLPGTCNWSATVFVGDDGFSTTAALAWNANYDLSTGVWTVWLHYSWGVGLFEDFTWTATSLTGGGEFNDMTFHTTMPGEEAYAAAMVNLNTDVSNAIFLTGIFGG